MDAAVYNGKVLSLRSSNGLGSKVANGKSDNNRSLIVYEINAQTAKGIRMLAGILSREAYRLLSTIYRIATTTTDHNPQLTWIKVSNF